MSSKALKDRVEKIGVPSVSKESGVGRTTLYEWLKNPAANLGLDRHNAVARAVEALSVVSSEPMKIAGEEFLPVPVYDIRAAAGAGALVEDGPPVTHQVFRSNFLQRLTRAPLEKLSVIEVAGDSMEPTMYGGDHVLVDLSVQSVTHDGIYILRLEETLIVKRCHRDISSRATHVISDNPRYPIDIVKASDRLQVLGRVIWIGRALR
jgi:phage repressor protein C with HTH and peptisase S24 domain